MDKIIQKEAETMREKEKVIKGLECCLAVTKCGICPYNDDNELWCGNNKALLEDVLSLLKEQEQITIEPKRIELPDETKAWLDKMDAVDALGNIADICMDWDGYRTANGLGGLVNEIWAYARYCADRLYKAQEPRVLTLEEVRALHDDTVVWLEDNDKTDVIPAIVNHVWNSLPNIVSFSVKNMREVKADMLLYRFKWRCWTSRPTDEQREATPWN